MKNLIYLDNNATTRPDPRVVETMMPYLTDVYSNSGSAHKFGHEANEAVKTARRQTADLLGCDSDEIIFTAGATEAVNIAIEGTARLYPEGGIVTVSTEHHAVLETCRHLESNGRKVIYLPVDEDGLIDPEKLRTALNGSIAIVCIMYVNNETGVTQDIKTLAEITHEAGALFMTDATQAAGKIPIDVNDMGIDLLCLSGHKFYAPKGIGALYARQRRPRKVKLPAFIHGGGQERGIRSGTLNVPGIAALGMACEIANAEMLSNRGRIEALRDKLESGLLQIENTVINGSPKRRLYNTSNLCFKGVDSDALIIGLGNPSSGGPSIAVSSGSACTSECIDPSHVLTAMGRTDIEAFNSIRFSLGRENTAEEIDIVINRVREETAKLREIG